MKKEIWTAKNTSNCQHKNVIKNELGFLCLNCTSYIDEDMVFDLSKVRDDTLVMSTYSNLKCPEITFRDIDKAMSLIKPLKEKKLVMCKKHWNLIKEEFDEHEEHCVWSNLAGLLVEVKPYLKKVRLYTAK